MKSLKGTKTEKNLLTAFSGESQARNRYTFFASKAKKEGYVEMFQAFEEIAGQEKEHAERLFKFLEGGEVEIMASFPAGKIGTTVENLTEAAAGENHEHSDMYPSFAKIAEVMRHIAIAEMAHEARFLEFAEHIKNSTVFKGAPKWRCLNCGYVHTGPEAPHLCPACAHPQAYFTTRMG